MFSILAGRHSHYLGKQTGKIIAVLYSYFMANLIYLDICTVYQIAGMLYLQQIEVIDR